MRLKDNTWAADFAEMGSLLSKNRAVRYLLCVIDVFTKYVWVKPLKDKKDEIVFLGFVETVNKSKSKRNKLWVDPVGLIMEENFIIALSKNG